MIKIYSKGQKRHEKPAILAIKKFNLKKEEIDLAFSDSLFFVTIFAFAIANNKAYLLSTDNKKPEIFELREIDKIAIEKKTDLNLFLRSGRVINLTSVVGASPKVVNKIKTLNEELHKCL